MIGGLAATALGGIGAFMAAHLHAMFYVSSPVIPGATCRLPRNAGRAVALTFDDGPHPEATPVILDVLAEADVRATFFMIGCHAAAYPEVVARVAAAGHTIGNHSYNHRHDGVMRGGVYWEDEIQRTAEVIHDACGAQTRWFRPPIGHRNYRQQRAVRRCGHHTLGWSCRSRDGTRTDVQAMADQVLHRARGRDIVLLHDGVDPHHDRDWRPSVELLRELLVRLPDAGFDMVLPPTPPTRDHTPCR